MHFVNKECVKLLNKELLIKTKCSTFARVKELNTFITLYIHISVSVYSIM